MSKLLEIFGKGITVNTADIIVQWLVQSLSGLEDTGQKDCLLNIADHLANRELIQAEEKLKQYLTDTADCVYARMAATAACLVQNDLNEAVKQAQSVYFRQPANTMALYAMGHCYERLGYIDQAIEFYQDCIKFKSYLQLPRQRLAAIYLHQGRLDLAIREYEILTSEHPEDITSITLLGFLYLAGRRGDQAADTFNLAILSHPDNFMNSQEVDSIESLIQHGMYEQALDQIKETIESVGPTADLIIRMGDVYSEWERDAEAIACYEHANRMEPNSLEAMIKLGTHYLRNQRFSLAAEQFNRACEINDEILDAYIGLATAQDMMGLPDEALNTLALACSIQKNSILLFSEAVILQFQSMLDDKSPLVAASDKDVVTIDHVIQVYEEKLRQTENDPDAVYKYGLLMSGENQLSKAVCAFRNAAALNPLNYRATFKLCLAVFEQTGGQEALEVLQENESAGAGSWEKFYHATMVYTDKQSFTKAIRKFNASRSVESSEISVIRTHLENMFESLGVIDRSFTSWERMNESSECLFKIFAQKHLHGQHRG